MVFFQDLKSLLGSVTIGHISDFLDAYNLVDSVMVDITSLIQNYFQRYHLLKKEDY